MYSPMLDVLHRYLPPASRALPRFGDHLLGLRSDQLELDALDELSSLDESQADITAFRQTSNPLKYNYAVGASPQPGVGKLQCQQHSHDKAICRGPRRTPTLLPPQHSERSLLTQERRIAPRAS